MQRQYIALQSELIQFHSMYSIQSPAVCVCFELYNGEVDVFVLYLCIVFVYCTYVLSLCIVFVYCIYVLSLCIVFMYCLCVLSFVFSLHCLLYCLCTWPSPPPPRGGRVDVTNGGKPSLSFLSFHQCIAMVESTNPLYSSSSDAALYRNPTPRNALSVRW